MIDIIAIGSWYVSGIVTSVVGVFIYLQYRVNKDEKKNRVSTTRGVHRRAKEKYDEYVDSLPKFVTKLNYTPFSLDDFVRNEAAEAGLYELMFPVKYNEDLEPIIPPVSECCKKYIESDVEIKMLGIAWEMVNKFAYSDMDELVSVYLKAYRGVFSALELAEEAKEKSEENNECVMLRCNSDAEEGKITCSGHITSGIP